MCMACALGVLCWDSLNNSRLQNSQNRKNNSPRYCGGGDIRKAIKDTLDSSLLIVQECSDDKIHPVYASTKICLMVGKQMACMLMLDW